jgi:hypothetical protein
MHYLDLYLNVDKPEGQACLLSGPNSMATASSWIILLGDAVTCRLWFKKDSGVTGVAPTIQSVLDAGESIVFGAKATSALDAPDFLFSQTNWATLTDANGNTHYEGLLTFDSQAFRTAFTGTTLPLTINVRLLSQDQTARLTYQFPAVCYEGAILGTEGIPDTGDPIYPTPEQLAASFNAKADVGDVQIPDRDNNNLLRRLVIKGGEIKFEDIVNP